MKLVVFDLAATTIQQCDQRCSVKLRVPLSRLAEFRRNGLHLVAQRPITGSLGRNGRRDHRRTRVDLRGDTDRMPSDDSRVTALEGRSATRPRESCAQSAT